MVTAFVVIFTFALLLLAGLVIDGGLTLAARVQAINEAQAAARAGAEAINIPLFRSTGEIVLDPAEANQAAESYLAATGHTGTVQVNGDDVDVTVSITQPMQILGIGGVGSLTVTGHGSAAAQHGVDGTRHMTRAVKIAKGLAALGLLAALVGGIPWALWRYVGWPLPHTLPSWSQFTTGLDQRGIPDRVLIDSLVCVVWISWVILASSVLAEIPAAVRGRTARRLPVVGPLQPFVGHLAAAVLVAALAVVPRPVAGGGGGGHTPLTSSFSTARPRQAVVAMALASDTADALATSPCDATELNRSLPHQPQPTMSSNAAIPSGASPNASSVTPSAGKRSTSSTKDTLSRMGVFSQIPTGSTRAGLWSCPPAEVGPAIARDASATTETATPRQFTGRRRRLGVTTPTDPVHQPVRAPPTETHMTTSSATSARAVTRRAALPHTRTESTAAPIRLPSGSVIAGSFASGVLAALAAGACTPPTPLPAAVTRLPPRLLRTGTPRRAVLRRPACSPCLPPPAAWRG